MARYTTRVTRVRGKLFVPVPFDPDVEWTPKPQHHVHGTVDGCRFRAVIAEKNGERGFVMGAIWLQDNDIRPDREVDVEIVPEGPQRADLAPDIAEAMERSPAAGAFFDSLAQFYRKAYLRWVDGTKKRPDVRAQRIADLVAYLEAGRKERPSG